MPFWLEGCKNKFTPFDQPVMSAGYLRHLPTTITISKSSKKKQKNITHHTNPHHAKLQMAMPWNLPFPNMQTCCANAMCIFRDAKKWDEANGHQSITWIQHISLDKKWINHDQTIYTIQLPPRKIRYPTNGKWTSSSQLPLKGICWFPRGHL